MGLHCLLFENFIKFENVILLEQQNNNNMMNQLTQLIHCYFSQQLTLATKTKLKLWPIHWKCFDHKKLFEP